MLCLFRHGFLRVSHFFRVITNLKDIKRKQITHRVWIDIQLQLLPPDSFVPVHAIVIRLFVSRSLGAQHDSAGNPCADVTNIMSTQASGKETAFEWSHCSRESIHTFLS